MAGYRSRIFAATSSDGLTWERAGLALEGDGYGGRDVGAVHAEDMSVIRLDDGRLRMYYAACDAKGVWRVASAISEAWPIGPGRIAQRDARPRIAVA